LSIWAWPGKKKNDDSAWPQGAALLADESVTVEPVRIHFSRKGYITFYFRTHFNYPNRLAEIGLRLRHVLDDGGVFYLNGVEGHRFGLAAGALD
jgi:hypothetical protein